MGLLEVARRRRMLRRFDPDRQIAPELLFQVMDLATYAPSAGNTQGRHFVVLTSTQDRERWWSLTRRPGPPDAWFRGVSAAPVVVLCCSDPEAYVERYAQADKGWADRDPARWAAPYWDIDTGMSALLVLLAAEEAGLGGLFFGIPADRHHAVRSTFDIPSHLNVVGAVALGYPHPEYHRTTHSRRRRRLHEVTHWGRFGTPLPSTAAECNAPPATM